MCAETTPEEAAVIAARIVDAVRQPTYVAGTMIAITASVGIASTASASTAVDVLRQADGAMYRAKARGRDQTSV
jgi:diguanylate cyclase (GGDEF)-like protein